MSQSRPPSPVHPRDINTSVRDMAEIQRPSFLPTSSFLGQPERHHASHGYQQHQPRTLSVSSQPGRDGQSSYNILPPLRTNVQPQTYQGRHAEQAVPIARLLSDVPCAPARTHPLPPPVPAYSHEPSFQPTSSISRHDQSPAPCQGFSAVNFRGLPTHQGQPFPQHYGAVPAAQYQNLGSPTTSKSPSSASFESGLSPREAKFVTSRTPSLSTSPHNVDYVLSVRQQPVAARACGFGERDRRVVDPPPILELILKDKETGNTDVEETPCVYTTLHCTLINAETLQDESQIEPHRPDLPATQRLMGTSVASPFPGKDEHGKQGTFFVFPDLSCRSPGKYRFRFRLLIVDPMNIASGNTTSRIQSYIDSAIFEVYTAKEFPGMRASSPLLKALRKQGLNVAVKKGREATKKSSRKAQADDEDSSGDGDEGDLQEDEDEEAESDSEKHAVASSSTDKRKRKRVE